MLFIGVALNTDGSFETCTICRRLSDLVFFLADIDTLPTTVWVKRAYLVDLKEERLILLEQQKIGASK